MILLESIRLKKKVTGKSLILFVLLMHVNLIKLHFLLLRMILYIPFFVQDFLFFFHNMLHTAFHTKSIDFLKESQNIYHLYDELSDESQEARYRIHELLLAQYSYSGKLKRSHLGIPIPVILS